MKDHYPARCFDGYVTSFGLIEVRPHSCPQTQQQIPLDLTQLICTLSGPSPKGLWWWANMKVRCPLCSSPFQWLYPTRYPIVHQLCNVPCSLELGAQIERRRTEGRNIFFPAHLSNMSSPQKLREPDALKSLWPFWPLNIHIWMMCCHLSLGIILLCQILWNKTSRWHPPAEISSVHHLSCDCFSTGD